MWEKRGAYDMQHRLAVGLEPGTLQLRAMCYISSATEVLQILVFLIDNKGSVDVITIYLQLLTHDSI